MCRDPVYLRWEVGTAHYGDVGSVSSLPRVVAASALAAGVVVKAGDKVTIRRTKTGGKFADPLTGRQGVVVKVTDIGPPWVQVAVDGDMNTRLISKHELEPIV